MAIIPKQNPYNLPANTGKIPIPGATPAAMPAKPAISLSMTGGAPAPLLPQMAARNNNSTPSMGVQAVGPAPAIPKPTLPANQAKPQATVPTPSPAAVQGQTTVTPDTGTTSSGGVATGTTGSTGGQDTSGSNTNGGATATTNAPDTSTYQGLIKNALDKQALAKAALDKSTAFNESLGAGMNDITKKPIALEFQQGQQAALQRDYGVQGTALASAASNANTLASQAAGVAGLSSPTTLSGGQYRVETQTGNPIGGGSAQDAAIKGAVFGANVASAGDAKSTLENITKYEPVFKAASSQALDLAKNGGLSDLAPIATEWRSKLGQTFLNDPYAAKFQAAVSQLNQAYADTTGNKDLQIDPTTMTVSKLKSVAQQMQDGINNKRVASNNYINSKTSSSSGTPNPWK